MLDEVPVQVALRVRPLVSSEIKHGFKLSLDCIPNEPQVVVRETSKAYTYNYVFGPDEDNQRVYDSAIKKMLTHIFKGYNATIMAYGQTGSGKTFTMGMTNTGDENCGVIPRAVTDIFKNIDELTEREVKVSVSFIELYQEQLFDLLAPKRTPLDIREDRKRIVIPGLTEVPVSSMEDTMKCLIRGSSGRATDCTNMNDQSSRSHAIFTFTITQQLHDEEYNCTTSKFQLVDLAGSERQKKTGTTGKTFREGININKGLFALGKVISALGDEPRREFIPYRESKLTRFLQDSLGGNSLTLMIACVSPSEFNLEETIDTLRYADQARKIRNKPIVNEDPKAVEIVTLKQEIQDLRRKLTNVNQTGALLEQLKVQGEQCANLGNEKRKLTEALNIAFSDITRLRKMEQMRELARDRMKNKFRELQAIYGERLDQTVDPNPCPPSLWEELQNLVDGQVETRDMEVKQGCIDQEMFHYELSSDVCNAENSEHVLPPMEVNSNQILKHKLDSCQGRVKELEVQVLTLQKENEDLSRRLGDMQDTASAPKRRKSHTGRQGELESTISALEKTIAYQNKLMKKKEASEKDIILLQSEIKCLKQDKVQLIRERKAETDQFKKQIREHKREISRLNAQCKKRNDDVACVERLYTNQRVVLSRKEHEFRALKKRLKTILDCQKVARDQRNLSVTAVNVRERISKEFGKLLSLEDAKIILGQLEECRSLLTVQLSRQKEILSSGPSNVEEKAQIEEVIKQLTEDIALRNKQIRDLKQNIKNSEEQNKYRAPWDIIRTFGDAKQAVKYMFDAIVAMKHEKADSDSKFADLKADYDVKSRTVQHQEQFIKDLTKNLRP